MKELKSIRISAFICLLCFSQLGMSQDFVPPLNQMISVPASPEAAGFVQYGNTPVSQYSGIPSISVPLGQLAGRSASLPVTLTYDASGIKVEQIASWVGLGWNLNVGGAVTRNVHGLPDDYTTATPKYFPYYSTKQPDTWGTQPTPQHGMDYYVDYYMTNTRMDQDQHLQHMVQAYKPFLADYNGSKVDTQPDTYSFSAMGISGTIFIDYSDGSAVCIEHPEYKVEPDLAIADSDNKDSRLLEGWTITDNQGNQYTFGKPEETKLIDYAVDGRSRDYYSAWYLEEFKSTNGKDVFTFNYGSNPIAFTNEQQLAGTASMVVGSPINTYTPKLDIKQYQLEEIKINGVKRLELIMSSGNRLDLAGRKYVDKIELFDMNGNSQDVIDLINDSYFTNGATTPTQYEQRLKLESIKILGASSAASGNDQLIKEYTFDYFENEGPDFIPSRTSFAQDHWGYYNNQDLNATLLPNKSSLGYSNGANREPHLSSALHGTLQKITYPTGGTTEFFYQQNYYPDPQGGTNLATGGFRVYKIEDKPSTSTVAQTRYFYYDELKATDLDDLDDDFFKDSNASSGILQVPEDFVLYTPINVWNGTRWSVSGAEQATILASNKYKKRISIVTYSTVTELKFDGTKSNGFTIHNFNNTADFSIVHPITQAPLNGKTKSTEVFDNNRKLLQSKALEFDYESLESIQGFQFESLMYQDYDGHETSISGTSYYKIVYSAMGTSTSVPYTNTSNCTGCLLPGPNNTYEAKSYSLTGRWIKLLSETSTSYEASGELTTTTTYSYDPYVAGSSHFEVVSTETKDSEQVVYTGFTYPQDLDNGSNIYYHMVNANRTGQVVKTITKRGGSGGLTLQEQETTFSGSASSQLPDEVKYATNGGALETRIEYQSHVNSNPTSLVKDNYQNIQYLWDHNGALPTAMITGVLDVSNAKKYAYTSFETDEKGNWSYAGDKAPATANPSGSKTYNLNGGAITRSSLSTAETYILAFWAKGTGTVKIDKKKSGVATSITQAITSTWTYYQIKVNDLDEVVISENAGGDSIELDELRLHANGSQMTTYAYDGAGRLISQLGPNGIPIHYEYDMHGRLTRVKDFEGNTLRLMEYEYQNTVGN